MVRKIIIFSDLDGTLLDSRYSYKKALPALSLLKKNKIPLILCSSKTRSEIEYYRKKLQNPHPFVSENGGGIFIPKNYFSFQVTERKLLFSPATLLIEKTKGYYLIKLGTPYRELKAVLYRLKSEGYAIKGFGEMSAKEISEVTGLRLSEAKMAKQRDFDEPFIYNGDRKILKKLISRIKVLGFNFTRGEIFHIMGNIDKGRAVEILKKLYEKQFGKLYSVALGDSMNDREMLKKVDYPVLVKNLKGSYNRSIRFKKLVKTNAVGPAGWNNAVMNMLSSRGKD
jgi:mannosyl-3-phosphoglycerate phosphatase